MLAVLLLGLSYQKYSLWPPLNLMSGCCPPVVLFLSSSVPPSSSCLLGVLLLFFGRAGKPCLLLLAPKQFTLPLSSPGFVYCVGRAAYSGLMCPNWPGLVRVCLSCWSTLRCRPFCQSLVWALSAAWPRRFFFIHRLVQVCVRVAMNATVFFIYDSGIRNCCCQTCLFTCRSQTAGGYVYII